MIVVEEDPFYQKVTNCVYVGYDFNGCFKIGMSNNWARRSKEIRNMNPSFDILLVIANDKPAVLEATLHQKFAAKRVVGEWFTLSAEDLMYIIETYMGKHPPFEMVQEAWKDCAGQELF